MAIGFLDFAVAVEFEDQAGGVFVGGAGAAQRRFHGLVQGLSQWQAEDARSGCVRGRSYLQGRFDREGNDAGGVSRVSIGATAPGIRDCALIHCLSIEEQWGVLFCVGA
jgi:hypothetical protein